MLEYKKYSGNKMSVKRERESEVRVSLRYFCSCTVKVEFFFTSWSYVRCIHVDNSMVLSPFALQCTHSFVFKGRSFNKIFSSPLPLLFLALPQFLRTGQACSMIEPGKAATYLAACKCNLQIQHKPRCTSCFLLKEHSVRPVQLSLAHTHSGHVERRERRNKR